MSPYWIKIGKIEAKLKKKIVFFFQDLGVRIIAATRGLSHGVVQALRACQFLIGEVNLLALFFREFSKFRGKAGKVIGVILLYGGEVGFADLVHCRVWGQLKEFDAIFRLSVRGRFF